MGGYRQSLDVHFDRHCAIIRNMKRCLTYQYKIEEHELDKITRIAPHGADE